MDKLTDADLILRLKVLKKHNGSRGKAAAELGLHVRNLQTTIAAAKAKGLTADTVLLDPIGKLTVENKHLKAELGFIKKANEDAAKIRERIYKLRDIPLDPPKWLTTKVDIKGPGIPMMLWSDWHFGEVVEAREVNGLNEFNSDIAEKRARILVERSLGLIRHHMPNGAPGAVICLGGDMITGEIHQELQDTNDKYVFETLRQLKGILATALTRVADECGQVFVPCVVGNHGRATLKPRTKGRVFTSYEWNLYTDLEDRLRDDKRIRFYIPDQTDAYFNVQGHRFLLTHGDALGVKGGDGIIGALGPILRGTFKVHRSESEVGREFDTILMGHWHQYISTRGLIVNNCLKGYDEFARIFLRAPATPASQALWFVDRKWGLNTQMEVYVQEPFRQGKKGDPWVSVFDSK
jgi:predicted phosphodiesterase